MQCDYYDAGVCRSCTLMGVPYSHQVQGKLADARGLLDPFVSRAKENRGSRVWLEPVTSVPSGFRNKAKMVVAGSSEHPSLGILDRRGRGVDLRRCGLIDPRIAAAMDPLADLVTAADLRPYDVPGRRGELKNVLITVSPAGRLMVRFVLRSTSRLQALRSHLPALLAAVPAVEVVSANILPEHKAVLEGDREIPLTEATHLDMELAGLTLSLRAKSFFQTNTEIAVAMYEQARQWCEGLAPATVWDLYCGVGGFALACAGGEGAGRGGRRVVGVEVSQEAVEAAAESARNAGLSGVSFVAADATAWAPAQREAPDLVVVNPPRRGLGAELAGRLEKSGVPHVVYSSCNATSLAKDLQTMASYRVRRARLFDMFPQSGHYETMVLLARE